MNQTVSSDTPADILLGQLRASRVHGFPFFAYTGIRPAVKSDNMLTMKVPSNPKKISVVAVKYDKGTDTYMVFFYRQTFVVHETSDVYVGELAETIAKGVGVF